MRCSHQQGACSCCFVSAADNGFGWWVILCPWTFNPRQKSLISHQKVNLLAYTSWWVVTYLGGSHAWWSRHYFLWCGDRFFWFLFTLLCTGYPGWLTSKILWSHDNEYVFFLNASTKFYKQSYDLKEIKNFNICFNIINSFVLEVTDISDKLSSAALMRLCVWHP